MSEQCPSGWKWDSRLKECVPAEPPPPPPPPPPPIPAGGLPIPVLKNPLAGVLGKICGEANEVVFIGLTDLFQQIADFFIPNIWPLTMLEEMFNNVFDALQENLKPFSYNQGVQMGDKIEGQVEAWIKSKFDAAKTQIDALKNQALGEIDTAKKELEEQAAKIQNLIERVGNLEGQSGIIEELKKRLQQ